MRERKALRKEGVRVSPFVPLDRFKKEWVKQFGPPRSESDEEFLRRWIVDFWEDYLANGCTSLEQYFKRIQDE